MAFSFHFAQLHLFALVRKKLRKTGWTYNSMGAKVGAEKLMAWLFREV